MECSLWKCQKSELMQGIPSYSIVWNGVRESEYEELKWVYLLVL